RKRTGRPTLRVSREMSTMRPRSETPSSSRTTATAYGTSAARPRGATRMTVKEVMAPPPAKGMGAQSRSWHAGQNSLGGMARSPHRRHRIAVSRPARASSKKCLSVTTRSATAEKADEDRGGVAAEGVRQARARALDLAQAGFATQLGDDHGDLRGARGADGMPLGLEAARRVDGELAAEAGPTLLRRETSSAGFEEAEPFRGNDLGDG